MKFLRIAALAILTLASPMLAQGQTMFRPVAVVNDSAITGYDLSQRAQMLAVLGAQSSSPEMLRNAAFEQLIEDRLKLQAGQAIGVTPTNELVNEALAELAEQRQLSVPEFKALLNGAGVSDTAITDLAAAEAVWRQVVRLRFGQRVQPGEAEIDSELAVLRERGNREYRFLELGLPLTADGRSPDQTRALAQRLYSELRGGGDFRAAVARYSRSPSAAKGGDVGWVPALRLPPDLQASVANLSVGQITEPLEVPGGVSILKLVETRRSEVPQADDEQLRERVRGRLIQRKSARLAEGLLQELRRDALIDVR